MVRGVGRLKGAQRLFDITEGCSRLVLGPSMFPEGIAAAHAQRPAWKFLACTSPSPPPPPPPHHTHNPPNIKAHVCQAALLVDGQQIPEPWRWKSASASSVMLWDLHEDKPTDVHENPQGVTQPADQTSGSSAAAQEAPSQPSQPQQKVAGEGRYRRSQAPSQPQQPAPASGSGDAFKPGAWKPPGT